MRLASLLLGFACANFVESRAAPACPRGLQLFASPPTDADGTPLGRLQTLANNITALIPHTALDIVRYNRTADDQIPHAEQGSQNLVKMVETFSKKCPTNKYVIISYSLGSILMMDSLCGFRDYGKVVPALDAKYAKNMLLATAYGDESQVAGESYDYGSCRNDGFYDRPFPYCGAFHNLIRSYCFATDARCCLTGNSIPVHLTYPDVYDRKLAKLTKSLYEKATAAA